ncbi:MAG: GAF domain-containing sensor histidine kinase [Pseudomonadota bacterium]
MSSFDAEYQAATEQDIRDVRAIPQVAEVLDVCCRLTGMRFSSVSRLTDKEWIACQVLDDAGLNIKSGDRVPVDDTLCNEVRRCHESLVIEDLATDERYANDALANAMGLKSYISVPIRRRDGTFFGTLCAMDRKARSLKNGATVETFELLAELVASQLDARSRLRKSQTNLVDERQTARLREQFIAVVGHDLRNPLASLKAGIRMLSGGAREEQRTLVLDEMQKAAHRMESIITNLMDFARGRLGGGIKAFTVNDVDITTIIGGVVNEVSAATHASIDTEIAAIPPVTCDPQRIGQMISNLVANAVQHGAEGRPVKLTAGAGDGLLHIAVSNEGKPIPPERLGNLFLPFERPQKNGEGGLGLGLYICDQIARAHDGRLRAVSRPELTTIEFTMPLPGEPAIGQSA